MYSPNLELTFMAVKVYVVDDSAVVRQALAHMLSGNSEVELIGSAPNRQFVVTWSQMKEWNSGSSLFNVQMILQESGDFIYQYKDIANTSQGMGQVGYQLSAADYVAVDLTTINSLAYSSLRFFKPTAPLAEGTVYLPAGTVLKYHPFI